jgi:hypothetical protein
VSLQPSTFERRRVDIVTGAISMLRLKRISELLKISADRIEGQNKPATGKATDEAAKIIRELRDTAREILTSQEYQNSRIKF